MRDLNRNLALIDVLKAAFNGAARILCIRCFDGVGEALITSQCEGHDIAGDTYLIRLK